MYSSGVRSPSCYNSTVVLVLKSPRSTHNINITPIGSLYIYFLDSKVKKYVFHNSLIYNSRNIHSQINSWNYYVIISLPWLLSPTFPWMLHCCERTKRPYFDLSQVTQETLWHLLFWVSQVTLCQFVLSKTRNLMTFVILTILVNILDTNETNICAQKSPYEIMCDTGTPREDRIRDEFCLKYI